MKALLYYLLELSIALLSSVTSLSAHSNSEIVFYSPKNSTVLEFAIACAVQDRTVSFNKQDTFFTERRNIDLDEYIIEIEEKRAEEDEELISFNKHSDHSIYAGSIFVDQTRHSSNYFSRSSSNRYLLFQVFRI